VSITPAGIGFVVLLGTILGFMVNYPLDRFLGMFVVGAVFGVMAMAASWAAFSVYDYFFAGYDHRRR